MVKPAKVIKLLIWVIKKVRKIGAIKSSWINELKCLIEKKEQCISELTEEIADIQVELEKLLGEGVLPQPGKELLSLGLQPKDPIK